MSERGNAQKQFRAADGEQRLERYFYLPLKLRFVLTAVEGKTIQCLHAACQPIHTHTHTHTQSCSTLIQMCNSNLKLFENPVLLTLPPLCLSH